MKVLGIDPGYSGALAILELIENSGSIEYKVDFIPMPLQEDLKQIDFEKVASWLLSKQFDHVYLEHVHAVFGSSASATFNFGRVFGGIEGVLGSLNIKFNLIQPKSWQQKVWLSELIPLKNKEMHPKEKSLKTIKHLMPDVNFKATKRSKLDHDGVIDAVLIALYGHKVNI